MISLNYSQVNSLIEFFKDNSDVNILSIDNLINPKSSFLENSVCVFLEHNTTVVFSQDGNYNKMNVNQEVKNKHIYFNELKKKLIRTTKSCQKVEKKEEGFYLYFDNNNYLLVGEKIQFSKKFLYTKKKIAISVKNIFECKNNQKFIDFVNYCKNQNMQVYIWSFGPGYSNIWSEKLKVDACRKYLKSDFDTIDGDPEDYYMDYCVESNFQIVSSLASKKIYFST